MRQLSIAQPVQDAMLRVAGDFCDAVVEINGKAVLALEAYSPTVDVPVKELLRPGGNRISVSAKSVGGPAAVAVSLNMTTVDGAKRGVVTDREWLVDSADSRRATEMGAVSAGLWGSGRRPATIDPFDNYEQWRQAVGAESAAVAQGKFWTAPGFEISLVRAALEDEGSWVSMAFDPRGRLTIAREDQGLLRMTLNEAHSAVERVETINEELAECRGLLYAHGSLYAAANNSKAFYRLQDADGDDRFEEVQRLRDFPGNVGHGRNDITQGSDGAIYAISGDAVDLPKENVLDLTSPFREARRGQNTREGFFMRVDPAGKRWEVLAAGLRNPFGVAMNVHGDLFTYDADAEFDMGTPWYRPTRVLQLFQGADFGWRGVTGKWPPYYADHADNAPPTLDIGKGSPTAVTFGYGGKFPQDYQQALFILDWAYGRILAVHLAPQGAGYRAQAETFVKGRPLNVTDVTVGPDGAMYVITGGRKTQSALYRISFAPAASEVEAETSHSAAIAAHAEAARRIREQLERHLAATGEDAVAAAWPHLVNVDPVLRYAARTALEHQPAKLWRERTLAPGGRLAGLLALARGSQKADMRRVVMRLAEMQPQELRLSERFALVHAYLLCLERASEAVMHERAAILKQLDVLFPYQPAAARESCREGTSEKLNRDLARLLAEIDAPGIVPRVMTSLAVGPVQEDRLQALFVLRKSREGWTPELRRAYFALLNDDNSLLGGQGMPRFLELIRGDALPLLSEAEKTALADLLQPQVTASEPLPPPRPVIKRWSAADFAAELASPSVSGDAQRGAAVFREALCARCHRAGLVGPAVGPDLTSVGRRFSPRDILESILEPSKVVADSYRNVQIVTTDGRQVVGRVMAAGDFRSEELRLATEPLDPAASVTISKRDIESYREVQTSPMPQGLLDGLTKQEVLDLLAFLAN